MVRLKRNLSTVNLSLLYPKCTSLSIFWLPPSSWEWMVLTKPSFYVWSVEFILLVIIYWRSRDLERRNTITKDFPNYKLPKSSFINTETLVVPIRHSSVSCVLQNPKIIGCILFYMSLHWIIVSFFFCILVHGKWLLHLPLVCRFSMAVIRHCWLSQFKCWG